MKYLVIDLFCGAGGVTTGIESAILEGTKLAKVIACVNHDPLAIESHLANHPEALHFTEDIRTLEITPLVKHAEKEKTRYPGSKLILWASLECTNFSNAKGGLPRDQDSRTLANDLLRYIEAIDPDYIMIENVREFMAWGPLNEKGKPVSRTKGRDYIRWMKSVCRLGYCFKHRILNTADYGAYTSRIRFFGIFARKGMPIVFPAQTHSKKTDGMFPDLKPWKQVKQYRCHSAIFPDEIGRAIALRIGRMSEQELRRFTRKPRKKKPANPEAEREKAKNRLLKASRALGRHCSGRQLYFEEALAAEGANLVEMYFKVVKPTRQKIEQIRSRSPYHAEVAGRLYDHWYK